MKECLLNSTSYMQDCHPFQLWFIQNGMGVMGLGILSILVITIIILILTDKRREESK